MVRFLHVQGVTVQEGESFITFYPGPVQRLSGAKRGAHDHHVRFGATVVTSRASPVCSWPQLVSHSTCRWLPVVHLEP